jgi:hypothetical protein
MALTHLSWLSVGWDLMTPPHFLPQQDLPEAPEGFSCAVCLSIFYSASQQELARDCSVSTSGTDGRAGM